MEKAATRKRVGNSSVNAAMVVLRNPATGTPTSTWPRITTAIDSLVTSRNNGYEATADKHAEIKSTGFLPTRSETWPSSGMRIAATSKLHNVETDASSEVCPICSVR